MSWERWASVDPGYDKRDEKGGGADGTHIRLGMIDRERAVAITLRLDTGLIHRPLQGPYYGDGRQHERADRFGLDEGPGARLRWPRIGPVVVHFGTDGPHLAPRFVEEQDDFECDVLGGRCRSDVGYTWGEDVVEATWFDRDNPNAFWDKLVADFERYVAPPA